MRCNRCNTKVMENQTHCPYCGKKLDKKSAYETKPKSDFNGVELISPEKPTAETPIKDIFENGMPMPGLVKTHDEVMDFGEEPKTSGGIEYEFDKSEKKDPNKPLFLDKGTVEYPDAPTDPDPDAASHFLPNREIIASRKYPGRSDKNDTGLRKVMVPPRNTNIMVGIMAVLLCLFLGVKGGALLLNYHGFFNPDLYINYFLPLFERVEIFFMLFLVWIMALVTRPKDLKWLAIIFALLISGFYGYVFYLFYWFKG